MHANKIGCVPVVDRGRVVGMLTGSDVLQSLIRIMDEGVVSKPGAMGCRSLITLKGGVAMRHTGKRLLISMAAILVPALVGVGAVTGSLAAVQKRHAGTVEMVNQSAGTIVIEDIGRRLKSGESEVHHVRVHVSPSAQFTRAQRVAGPGPEGWIGAYAESPLPAWEVKKGDFAVVTMDGAKGVKVTVVDLREP